MFDPERLQEYIDKGLVRSQTDGNGLVIYNYTETCAFDRVWDDVTTACRGLILRGSALVARPFPKFFNLGERPDTPLPFPDEFYYVQDKLDGSLIIVAHDINPRSNNLVVATRGSFQSDQAIHAREILSETYPDWRPPRGWTVLFEILYPTNRIVVDYGPIDDLVLLGAINNDTGEDWPFERFHLLEWPGSAAVRVAVTLSEITSMIKDPENGPNREGFVVVWPREGAASFRLKMKFAQYVMLHKIVTGLSTTTVWEALSMNQFAALLEVVPDEWHGIVRETAAELVREFNAVADSAEFDLSQVDRQMSRKDQAALVTKFDYPHLVFAMLDGKPVEEKIWKMIKPVWATLQPVLEFLA